MKKCPIFFRRILQIIIVIFLICAISGCSLIEKIVCTKKYKEIPTGYDNTYWCMSRKEVKDAIDIDELLLIEDENSISTYESRLNSEFSIFCLDLMNPPKITYKFCNDMLYEIELELEDSRITEELYNEFSDTLSEKYIKGDYEGDEDYGVFSISSRSWDIDEKGSYITLIFHEYHKDSIVGCSSLNLSYQNINLNMSLKNENE